MAFKSVDCVPPKQFASTRRYPQLLSPNWLFGIFWGPYWWAPCTALLVYYSTMKQKNSPTFPTPKNPKIIFQTIFFYKFLNRLRYGFLNNKYSIIEKRIRYSNIKLFKLFRKYEINLEIVFLNPNFWWCFSWRIFELDVWYFTKIYFPKILKICVQNLFILA
jgi:hypothetical protein